MLSEHCLFLIRPVVLLSWRVKTWLMPSSVVVGFADVCPSWGGR